MTDLEFRTQVLDSISAGFCGAKWYNVTTWLGSGITTSCHYQAARQVGQFLSLIRDRSTKVWLQ